MAENKLAELGASGASYLGNLFKNVLFEATGGLVGLEQQDPEVLEWREENPVTSFISSLAGFGGALGTGYKAVKGTRYGLAAKRLGRAEKFAETPFKARALEEMALWAPVEFGRQAVGYGIQAQNPDKWGEPDLGERVLQAGIDIGTAGLLGGAIGKFSAAGKRTRVENIFELESSAPWQEQLKKARNRMESLTDPDQIAFGQRIINNLEGKILREDRRQLITPFEGAIGVGKIGSIFKGTGSVKALKLAVGSAEDSMSPRQLEEMLRGLDAIGVPKDWVEYAQFPRYVRPVTSGGEKAIKRINTAVEELNPVGDGWRLGKEQDGLFVLAKPIDETTGRWFMTKTDNPGRFIPSQEGVLKQLEANAFVDPDSIVRPTGNPDNVLDRAIRMQEAWGAGYGTAPFKQGSVASVLAKGRENRVVSAVLDNELIGRTGDAFSTFVKPTVFQFKESPLARKIYGSAITTYENTKRRAQEIVHGALKLDPNTNVWKMTSAGLKRNDPTSVASKARTLASKAPEQFKGVLHVIDNSIPWEKVQADDGLKKMLGGGGMDLLGTIQGAEQTALGEIFDASARLGIPERQMFGVKKGHYGFSHYWKGSLRQGITDEKGNLVHIVAGDNRKGIRKTAEGIIQQAEAGGNKWNLGEFWAKESTVDLAQEKLLSADAMALGEYFAKKYSEVHPTTQASFFKQRAGIGGYDTAKNAEELISNFSYSLENKYRWLAGQMNEKLNAKDIATLAIDNPQVASMLEDKLRVMRGEQGMVSGFVNKLADSILAPVLGKDSASKIVRALNTSSVYLDLGFANMAYVTANMLQPVTTVLPQLSLLSRCPEALAWAYDTVPIVTAAGKAQQASVFSPLKIMRQGWRMMAKPDEVGGFRDFLEKSVKDGVLSPRFIESYIGEGSLQGSSLKEAFKKGDFPGLLKGAATTLPTWSEQASRGYALSVGYAYFDGVAKATGRLTREQVEAGARRFMENTMFQFAASDRAMILQGPVGQAWGLFKNWTMHYVGWQMQYLEAGLKYNCWTPYMFANLATSSLGGLSSSEIGASAEKFTEWASGEKMSTLLYDRWGDNAGSNMLMYGIPGAFGYSLRSQINSPFNDPGEELQRFMGMVYSNRLSAASKAVGAAVDHWETTGKNPASSRDVQMQLSRALAPKMVYRSMQIINDGLISSSTKTQVVGDLSPMEQVMYQYFNIPSTRIEQGFKISNEIWKDKEKRNKLTAMYSNAMADALESQDGTLLQRIIDRALIDGVDIDSVMTGANKRLENRQLDVLMRNPDYAFDWGGSMPESRMGR